MESPLLGNHPSIEKIRELITLVSGTAFNVLLLGETGTGKEVVARLLHSVSPRRQGSFIKVNCAALPLTLLESELFGYEKGAFTGADRFKPGKFELASGGVIFLDEIGDMPMVLQVKLLNVLQSGEFNRLGGNEDVKVHAWVISATNHDLETDMKQGVFREDLYYRMNIIKVELPPLRERTEDIPLLTRHFIDVHRRNLGIAKRFSLNSDLKDLFQTFPWPGNVRELSNTLLRLVVGEEPERVKDEMVSSLKSDGAFSPDNFAHGALDQSSPQHKNGIQSESIKPLKEVKSEAASYIEKKVITHALKMTGGNRRNAARMLGISYKALFYKIANFGIER